MILLLLLEIKISDSVKSVVQFEISNERYLNIIQWENLNVSRILLSY